MENMLNRNTGNSLRISLNKSIDEMDPEFAKIRNNAFSGSASKEAKMEFENHKDELSQNILDAPAHELFKIEKVEIEIPEEARIFQSVKCAKCGELVAEHRAWVENNTMF